MLTYLKINNQKKYNKNFIKKEIKKLNLNKLKSKKLLTDEVGTEASIIAKDKNIRKLVHSFQLKSEKKQKKKIEGY